MKKTQVWHVLIEQPDAKAVAANSEPTVPYLKVSMLHHPRQPSLYWLAWYSSVCPKQCAWACHVQDRMSPSTCQNGTDLDAVRYNCLAPRNAGSRSATFEGFYAKDVLWARYMLETSCWIGEKRTFLVEMRWEPVFFWCRLLSSACHGVANRTNPRYLKNTARRTFTDARCAAGFTAYLYM